jgi:hypothetical protein
VASPSPTISPISNSVASMFFRLGGFPSPGTIPKGGLKGFKRESGWHIKDGKGSQGATLTLVRIPPIKGTITVQLFTDIDFTDWDDFVANVLSIAPTKQQAEGLTYFYSLHASLGLTQVVVAHYTAPEHQGKGMYHASIELIEWQPPPPASVVSTVASLNPNNEPFGPPKPPDPRQEAIRALKAKLGGGVV